MNLNYEIQENVAIIHFMETDLTATCEESFRNTLNILFLKRIDYFILDFKTVEFMNSFFLAILMETYKSIKDRNGRIVAAELTPSITTIFHVMRLNEIIPVYNTVGDARKAIEELSSPSEES